MPYAICSTRGWRRPAGRLGLCILVALALGGCSLITSPYPAPPPPGPAGPAPSAPSKESRTLEVEPVPAPPAPPAPPADRPGPRAQASLELTSQGRRLLLGGQVDEAISLLERATGLNPDNGRAYYWLAEAWLSKGNPSQALEYHHQAWLRLHSRQAWDGRLRDQRRRLENAAR